MRDVRIDRDHHVWVDRLRVLVGNERRILVELLLLLGHVDHQKLYLSLGYASSWDFIRRGLGQSERMTFYRLSAARVLFRFPFAMEMLRAGELCMTTLAALASVLTDDNARSVLGEAVGKSKVEISAIRARLDPRPLPADVVRRVVVRKEVTRRDGLTLGQDAASGNSSAPSALTPGDVVATDATVATSTELTPGDAQSGRIGSSATVSATRTEVLTTTWTRRHMNTDGEFEDLLRRLRMAYSHKMPAASEVDILKAVMRQALLEHEKRKGIVKRPRAQKQKQPSTAGKRAIPNHVKREVWLRDGGCCQWPTADGGVCGSTLRVEFHHLLDRGLGGLHTTENLILACAIHNRHAAEKVWGKTFMDQFRGAPPRRTDGGSTFQAANPCRS